MGKLKLAEGKRARPIPISLKPKHLLMLSELEKYMRRSRSRIVQMLVEQTYDKKIRNMVEGTGDESE